MSIKEEVQALREEKRRVVEEKRLLEEKEKLQKELHPSIFDKISNFIGRFF